MHQLFQISRTLKCLPTTPFSPHMTSVGQVNFRPLCLSFASCKRSMDQPARKHSHMAAMASGVRRLRNETYETLTDFLQNL